MSTGSAQDSVVRQSALRNSLDNAIDMSDWLIQKKGFLLLPAIITEPAVGYGIAGAAVFLHSSYTGKHGHPSMSGAFGAITENGTWATGKFQA